MKSDPYYFFTSGLPYTSSTTSISHCYGCHLNCRNDLRVLTLQAIKATLFLGSQSIIHSLEAIVRNSLDKSQNIIHSMSYQTRSHVPTKALTDNLKNVEPKKCNHYDGTRGIVEIKGHIMCHLIS